MDSAHFPTLAFFIYLLFFYFVVFCCHGEVGVSQQPSVDVVTLSLNFHNWLSFLSPEQRTSASHYTHTHTHGLNWIWEGVATCAWLQHCYQHVSGNSNPVSISLLLCLSADVNSLFSCSSHTGPIHNPIKIRPLFTACTDYC